MNAPVAPTPPPVAPINQSQPKQQQPYYRESPERVLQQQRQQIQM